MENILKFDDIERGGREFPQLKRFSSFDNTYLEKLQQFYRGQAQGFFSDHVITKLLYSFHYNPESSDREIYEWAIERQAELAAPLGITNVNKEAEPKESLFYPNCHDYLITCNEFTSDDVLENSNSIMEEYSAVVVYYHPYIAPTSFFPTGGSGSTYYSVIGIDIPLLAIQFKHWQQYNKGLPLDEQLSIEHFTGTVVLPNMLHRQAEISRFNMLLDIVGFKRESLPFKTPTDILDTRDGVYKELVDFIEIMRSDNRTFGFLFTQIPPIVGGKDWSKYIPHIQTYDLKQTYRCSFLANLPYVWFATIMAQDHPNLADFEPQVKKMVRITRFRQTLTTMNTDNGYHRDVKGLFNEIKTVFNVNY